MSTVSARPDNLAAYHSRLEGADRDVRATAGTLLRTLEAYRTRCPQYGADHTQLAYSLGQHATAMEDLDGWVGRVGEAFRHADRAPGPVPVGVVLTTDESVKVAEPEFEELEPEGGMDPKAIAALIADITGIFDPTPISDGVAAGIDLSDGDVAGAGLSLLSMVPYLGDAVAKPVKFVRRVLEKFPALKRLAESGALLDLLKHIDWKNPARLNRALGALAALQRKAELAYQNTDWLNKARRLGLPTEGGVPFVPPKNWDVNFPRMAKVNGRDGYVDAFGNVWVKNGEDWYIQPRRGFEPLTKDGSPSLSVGKDGKLQDPLPLTTRFSSAELNQAFEYANTEAKLEHVFGNARHGFNQLVQSAGGRAAAMRKLVDSLADGAGLPEAGKFEVVRTIDGARVTIRGAVVDGIPKIGTAFIAP